MDTVTAALVSAVLTLLVLLIAAYVWHQRGWTSFYFQQGARDAPSWPAAAGGPGRLRFRSVQFAVTAADGRKASWDVTPVLNAMAVAYTHPLKDILMLELSGPLSSASFTPPPGAWTPAPGDTATLGGYYRVI